MTKYGAIIPICIIAVSGCSLYDNPEMSNQTAVTSAPAVEEAQPRVESAQIAVVPPPVAIPTTRSMTAEDVRRLQMRLRELGFDAGPVDGVAGAKTKTAFSRLQAGCGKLEPLAEKLPVVDGISAREDVVRMQNDLRAAGFNPGPVDGVYGARTKSMVTQLRGACFMAKEFGAGLDESAQIAKNESAATTPQESARAAAGMQVATVRQEGAREDVRILQLRLRDAGFDPGPFDGVMGAKTKIALAQYEASQRNSKVKTSLPTTRISGQY